MFKPDLSNCFRKANKKFAIFALALGVLLCLSGCKSAELQAVEKSASILQITTGQEVSRALQDKGVALGKPVYAEIIIVYEPINNHTKEDVFEELVAILRKNGWKEEGEGNTVPVYFIASWRQNDFQSPLLATVVIRADKNLVNLQIANHNR